MRKLQLLIFMLITIQFITAKNQIIENPSYFYNSHSSVMIDKVVLNDTETTLCMTINQKKGRWIMIASDTYIRANGQKYIVKSANGITLDKETYPDDSEKIIFTLHFSPIDPSTQQIDFIESDCEDCFKIWGVQLNPYTSIEKVGIPEKIKQEAIIKEDGKSLEIPQLKFGDAIFNGKFMGYIPDMKWNVEMYVDNPVTGIQEELETKVKEDGSFELKVPLVSSMQVLLRISAIRYNDYILLSPDKESVVYFDIQQYSCQRAANEAHKCPKAKYIYFTGANAEINNQMEDIKTQEVSVDEKEYGIVADMSAEQYKSFVLEKLKNANDELSQKGLTKKAIELATITNNFHAMYNLMFGESTIQEAFRKKHNLKYEDDLTNFQKLTFDANYYSFINDLQLNNAYSLYSSYFGNIVNSCKYINRKSINFRLPSKEMYQKLIDSGKLSADELKLTEQLKAQAYDNWDSKKQQAFKKNINTKTQELVQSGKLDEEELSLAKQLQALCSESKSSVYSIIEKQIHLAIELQENKNFSTEEKNNLFNLASEFSVTPNVELDAFKELQKKYDSEINFFYVLKNLEQKKDYLAGILGTKDGIALDIMETQIFCRKFDEKTPLTTEELNEISRMKNPFYYSYVSSRNNQLLTETELNKNKKGYNVYETPETDNEKVFSEIIKQFAGKVIFVDFWATWCGPCRSAMKQFEPAKKQFEGKDVAFVYLTDESSPLGTWKNMIPDIPGEHFRLKNDQFKELKAKFGVKGIPSYLILDKKGNQVYFRVGFEGASKLSGIITSELNK